MKTLDNKAGPEELVPAIQQGDRELREQFLRQYQGFVAGTVSKALGGRSVDRHRDDAFNIGMMALNESLDKFDPAAGASFLNFARQVITRRVIDSLRKDARVPRSTSLSVIEEKGGHPALAGPPAMEQVEVKEEYRAFVAKLKSFGITMPDLVKSSPRHRDSKQLAISIGKILAGNPEMMEHLNKKKTIPLKNLMQKCNVNPKTVERHRIYIIAVAIIMSGNLETLKGYLQDMEKGGGRGGA